MSEENELFGNAGEIYFAPVEGESGLDLTLEEDVRLKFVGLVEDRFEQAERAREHDESRWLQAYHNFRGLYPKNSTTRIPITEPTMLRVAPGWRPPPCPRALACALAH